MRWFFFKSFADLQHKPLLVDLTVEEGQRLKVIFGSHTGFHVIDVDSGNSYDIYIPSHVSLRNLLSLGLCITVCMYRDLVLPIFIWNRVNLLLNFGYFWIDRMFLKCYCSLELSNTKIKLFWRYYVIFLDFIGICYTISWVPVSLFERSLF